VGEGQIRFPQKTGNFPNFLTLETVKYTDVLIVGAGPSGLMMAAQLLRYGIAPMIIDAKAGPDRTSKAIAIHARSLEFFRQMGLADELLAKGYPCYGAQVQGRKRPLGNIDLNRLADPGTVFPFIHIISQDQTERLLIKRLTENACPVIWETRLIGVRQDDREATVTLEQNGTVQRWKCKWVVGADGVESTVRKSIGIPFEGKPYHGRFFLADVHIQDVHQRNIHFFLGRQSALGIFPFDTNGHYRLIGKLPMDWTEKAELRYTHIKPLVDGALGVELPVNRCTWVSEFTLCRRMAEQFARQRCFLIGDAAHVHSPVGGLGMNTGMQDAVNLAWKLAGVIGGQTSPRVLYTYQQERIPVARDVIRMADRGFNLTIGLPHWLTPLRDMLLTALFRYAIAKPSLLHTVFARLAQLNTHYRRAGLAVHHAMGMRVRAGDRLPFLPVFDEKTKTQTDLHRWCEKPGFVLLVLGTISHHHLHIIGQWMRQKYPRHMYLYYLPYSPRNQSVFDVFEVKPAGTKSVLVRPDLHIGYINDMLNVSLIDTYMEEIIGWESFGHLPENT